MDRVETCSQRLEMLVEDVLVEAVTGEIHLGRCCGYNFDMMMQVGHDIRNVKSQVCA